MVKPPKSMQPESVDLTKAGRASSRAFQEDSFHHYMARKIDLQRQQFGLVIPPPPLPASPKSHVKPKSLLKPATSPPQKSPSRSVHFGTLPERTTKSSMRKTDMESILQRLQKRHGRVRKSLGRKRKRREMTDSNNHALKLQLEKHSSETKPTLVEVASIVGNDPSIDSAIEEKMVTHKNNIRVGAEISNLSPSSSSLRQSRPDLFFLGIVVKVNGYTDPDNVTIKRMLQKHGGDFETYETDRVTHIIAEQLSSAKHNMYKRQRKPKPVCTPAWIVDSVKEGKLLPHGDYLLQEQTSPSSQVNIHTLFGVRNAEPPSKTNLRTRDGLPLGLESMNHDEDTKELNSVTKMDKELMKEQQDAMATQSEDSTKTGAEKGETNNTPELKGEIQHTQSFGKTDSKYINGKIRTIGTDPNFLESFFKNSRLSFIGSYKQRNTAASSVTKSVSMSHSKKLKGLVFHVDMDSFFASVVLRNFPQYKDRPVAICHYGKKKDNNRSVVPLEPEVLVPKNSSSECATCNYKAREFGIKKGMFLGRAKQLCPDLVVLHYDFDGYEEVSEQVLDILHRTASERNGSVEAVSCDEAYMELMFDDEDDYLARAGHLAESIRTEIFETTQCTASIGVAANKFLAKLGTDKVKPNGSFVVRDYQNLLHGLKLRDLHGVGYRTEPKLAAEGLVSVQDIWDLGSNAESILCRVLGPGLGKRIFLYSQGKDDRPVKPAERKTIGAECNYGVRFDGPYGIDYFMNGLATEVERRMEGVGVKGRRVTLKVKQRKKGARPPPKFLGHGSCNNLSKSAEIPGSIATRDSHIICGLGMTLFRELKVPLEDLRGMGIIISKLTSGQSPLVEMLEAQGIESWLKQGKQLTRNESQQVTANGTPIEHNKTKTRASERDEYQSTTEEQVLCLDQHPLMNTAINCDDVITGLPEHFQREVLDEGGENNCTTREFPLDLDTRMKDDEVVPSGQIKEGVTVEEIEKLGSDFLESPTASKTESSQAFTQIALPPLSQIRMSQVEALPSILQQQIISKIRVAELKESSRPTLDDPEVIEVDESSCINNGAVWNGEGSSNEEKDHVNEQIEKIENRKMPRIQSEQGNHRFRQTSVKRMMKLAAVKSGQQITDIALSQLDHLPLELKLQVVNDDASPVGTLSQLRNFDHQSTAAKVPKAMSKADSVDESPFQNSEKTMATESDSQDEQNTKNVDNIIKGGENFFPDEPVDVYHEDILPLKVFLDENSPFNSEAVSNVVSFLTTCLKEGRTHILAALIRSIRYRQDDWSNGDMLAGLVETLDEKHLQQYGSRLDTDWLLGR